MIYEEESFELIGAGMTVHQELSCGYLEAVYQEALAIELRDRGIPFECEKPLRIFYRGRLLDKHYYADFICYDKIIIELKVARTLVPEHEAQLLNYLKASGCKLGFLFNFGTPSFQYKRFVF